MGKTKEELWKIAVDEHNKYRIRHGVPPLKGDDEEVHGVAQRYAQYLASNDLFQHSNNRRYGENLAGALGNDEGEAIAFAVKMWYDEIKSYNYGYPGFSMATGHFTAVVWKSSTHVGIGVAYNSRKRWWVVVGNYSPPGNMMGAFPENVPRLLPASEIKRIEEKSKAEIVAKDSDKKPDKDDGDDSEKSDPKSDTGKEKVQKATKTKTETKPPSKNLANPIWQAAVDEHNKYRRIHGCPLLKGNDESMHNAAQKHANFLASRNCFQNTGDRRYGENLAGVQGKDEKEAIENALKMWYEKGSAAYNYRNPGFHTSTGNFTQVVWKSSTHVGIGVTYNNYSRWWVVVAYYREPGNVMGQFPENVKPPCANPDGSSSDTSEDDNEEACSSKLKALKLKEDTDDKSDSSSSSEEDTSPKLKNELWQVAVDEHNKYRRRHGVPDIKGNDEEIHNVAQSYAEHLASHDQFKHSGYRGYGENLAGAQGCDEADAIRSAVKMWYDEIKSYNFGRPGFASGTGHFTAVVWKESTHVGIGVAYNSRKRWWVVVANYSPAGNVMGFFPQNVLPPKN